jgi:hypothetical protein
MYKNIYKRLISNKMRCLSDFNICDERDEDMKAKLEQAILDKPDKDPQEVLDHFCRPMIQAKVNSWDEEV